MSVNVMIRMPDGSEYKARLGHWLPNLIGSSDTVIGGEALFDLEWNPDGTMASPTAGHLGHAGIHVADQRKEGLDKGILKALRALLWWWSAKGKDSEKRADAFAEANERNKVLVAEEQRLRKLVHRS